jgi:hypothetical protein
MFDTIRRSLLTCSLSTLALAGCSFLGGDPVVHTDPFTQNTLDRYVIHNTPQAWSIRDGYLTADTAARQSVVIRAGEVMSNGWVETETDSTGDGGLVLRFSNGGDYYLMAVRDDSHFGWANVELYRAEDGEFTVIAGPLDVLFPVGERNIFRFEASGSQLTGYMNGVPVIRAVDTAYTVGGFGLRHDNTRVWPGVTSRFDLLRWRTN